MSRGAIVACFDSGISKLKSIKEPREIDYRVLRILEREPNISQRDLAKELGISLGSVNYCLQALARVGWIKVKNFKSSKNKKAYFYILTPAGIHIKAVSARKFLHRKRAEYEKLAEDIRELEREIVRGPHL